MSGNWISIDYTGQEEVNFVTWKWRYSTGTSDYERDLKRDEDGNWFITDDGGYWCEYDEEQVGVEKILESFYQMWLNKQVEDILLT